MSHVYEWSVKNKIYQLSILVLVALCGTSVFAQIQAPLCEPPNVLIILDHSGSMGRNNKWDDAKEAIQGVTLSFETRLRFGLMYFPTNNSCGVDENRTLLSNVSLRNSNAIISGMNILGEPTGETPFAKAINEGVDYYNRLNDQTRQNVIIAITDGDETCGGNPPNAAGNANSAGYPVYVIGFGNGISNPQVLQRTAERGGTNNYYQATDARDLLDVLNEIADQTSVEVCDGVDNDCDGLVDESNGVDGGLRNSCGECGELGEDVCDGLDNDCDGSVDENILPRACENDCGIGQIGCVNGIETGCEGGSIPVESCDGADNDCDGLTDESIQIDCMTESGNPGVALCLVGGVISEECEPLNPEEICDGVDNDLDGETDEGLRNACGDCGELDADICDGEDNDCDGTVDENTDEECNFECHTGSRLCIEGQLSACTAAPVVDEVCNLFDDDCDGLVDEMATCPNGQACGPEGLCLEPCDNGECFVGFRCNMEDDLCYPPACEPSCNDGEICINEACYIPCLVDAQCVPYNQTCDEEYRVCVGAGMSVPSGLTPVDDSNSSSQMNDMNSTEVTDNEPVDSFVPPESEGESQNNEAVSGGVSCQSNMNGSIWSLLVMLLLVGVYRKRQHG